MSQEKRELERISKLYRQNLPMPQIQNKIIILIDDGLATGASMEVVIRAIKKQSTSDCCDHTGCAAVNFNCRI